MKLPSLAIQNYPFTIVMMVLLTLLGVVSFMTMPRAEDPAIQTPGTSIIVVFPGASPADLESLIVDPIEEALNELEDIRRMASTTKDGVATVVAEFYSNVEPDDAYDKVTLAVNGVRGDFPPGVLSVETFRFSTADVSILQVALVSEAAGYRVLQEQAEELEKQLERVAGVMRAETWAYPESEVRVGLDLDKMREIGLPLDRVVQSIQANAQNIPGGSVDLGQRRYNIQTSGDYGSLDDIRNTIVHSMGDRIVYLKDIAAVDMGFEDDTYRARYNGERAVFVTVVQREGTNIFTVMEGLNARLAEFERALPEGVRMETAFDQSISVHERVNSFFGNLLQGVLLVGVVILLALGARASAIVVLAIPVSVMIAIGWVDMSGYGIQQMSIVGLVVALGLLVDNAIVVVENITRFRKMGHSGYEAAIQGTKEVGWPIVASTATTVLSFLPIVFMESDSGQYIRSMPVTVIYALLASLLISLTLTPFLASRYLKVGDGTARRTPWLQRGLDRLVAGPYARTLTGALRRPALVLIAAFATFAGSLALFPLVGVSLFPKAEKPQFIVNVETSEGANLDYTDAVTRQVEAVLAGRDEVAGYAANIGRDNPRFYYNVIPRGEKSNIAQIMVEASDIGVMRTLIRELKTAFAAIPGADIDILELENGPPVEAPIAIKVIGDEIDQLERLASEVEGIMQGTDGTDNIDNPMRDPKTDLHVRINRDKAGLLGVPLVEIDRTVRAGLAGLPVATYRDAGGEDHAIVVRLPLEGQPTMADFDRINVSSFTGASIPLRQVADVELESAATRIDHYNLERNVTVTSFVEEGYSEFEVTDRVIEQLQAYPWPAGYRYFVAGKLESQQESFSGLTSALVVALLGILGVLVLQFRSFGQPLIVITAVPLAIVGAVPALLITGYTFSFSAFIGLTSLVGIVVNNSIILVDYANQLVKQGRTVEQAVREAGATRFSPIVLTTLTTVGGLLPLTLTNSTMWSPMGWVIIGGLLASTVLTLVVVPVLYKLLTRG
ncbi:MAG: efflux RND transporter permease subunit [Rhodothermales bacterium]|nr:efflux RND transporter permease subunit [Rhodothermales bacterium]